ncbi:hypothetical protein BH10PSE14_BH10PSE14_00150 [soil metagenome]
MWNIRDSNKRLFAAILCALLAGLPQATSALTKGDTVREQRTLMVGGVAETWQLIWRGRPLPVCPPDDMDGSMTEPCSGLAYGEYGDLWLVRKRHGREIERMDLKPIFGRFQYPDADKLEGKAWLQRRAMKLSDIERAGPAFLAEVSKRPITTIMKFADYDRDGHATEFLIQVGTFGGGVRLFAGVGVSKRDPHLHALSSAEKPGVPVEMQYRPWRTLLTASKPTRLTTWQCDDHSSAVQQDLIVWARRGDIHFKEILLRCPVAASARRAS